MRWSELEREDCPVARAMSVFGDRWTVLILRDAIRGVTRFDDFLRRLDCSRAMLSKRLAHLTACGMMEATPYQERPVRHDYVLTDQGRALGPILMMISEWAEDWMPKATSKPLRRRHKNCGAQFRPVVVCSECREPVRPGQVEYLATEA